ncbi:asialoglycoprotein receptor 1-like [Mytilus trossulus]|uniref:asialoglycoprotein receptor 1-like n=1 Tax=Mytilus trossulus TaxID=6551 RepID=UPI00300476CB
MKSASMVTPCIMGMVINDVFALQCLSNDSKTKLQATKNLKTSMDSRIQNYQKDMETKMKKLFDDMGSIRTDMKSKINKLVDDIESVVQSCQSEKIQIQWKEYKGHYYFYGRERLTWTKAEQRCRQIGGHLAKIDDEAENKWIMDNRTGKNKAFVQNHLWMGLTDLKEGEYRWSYDQTIAKYKPWFSGWGGKGY